MVQTLFLMLVCCSLARADFFGFGSDQGSKSRIPPLVEKLVGLSMKNQPAYEDEFNSQVKLIETAVEEEKLFCSGEATDAAGKTLPREQKELCFRELKKNYLKATTTIFDLKKKYLGFLHAQQIERMTEIQKKLRSDIEKNF